MGVHDDFGSLIEAATDRPVIMANENGRRLPDRPFITVRIDVGQPQPVHVGLVDDDGVRSVAGHRPVAIQLQCYGAGSWDVLDRLQLSLYTEAVLDLAESLNISVLREPRLQDVPALLDGTKYEPRAILDLEAMYTGSIDDDVGFIQTVNGGFTTTPGEIPERSFTLTVP